MFPPVALHDAKRYCEESRNMDGSTSIVVRQVAEGRQGLELDGEVTVFAASQLHQEAVRLATSGQDVTVCCEHLDAIDASTLQVLVALKEALGRQGKSIQFSGMSEDLLGTIRLAGLADRFGAENNSLPGEVKPVSEIAATADLPSAGT